MAIIFFLKGLVLIKDDKVGIVTRKMTGREMPQGQIIARSKEEIGVQANTLMPKLYWFMPFIWSVKKVEVTVVAPGQIGIVESIDGESLPSDRVFGDSVECNQFQDATAFLNNKGKKGPQVAVLRPGKYRINTEIFHVKVEKATEIPEEKIGVVVAQDGQPLPSGYIIAPQMDEIDHRYFQNGQDFVDGGGYRGPQLDTLQPGQYYINSKLFKVSIYDISDVPPGYVAVIRSNVGKELAKTEDLPAPVPDVPDFGQPVHEKEEVVLTNDKFKRGIFQEPVGSGRYNLNPLAYTPFLVPTSAITIDWAAGEEVRTDGSYDRDRRFSSGETLDDKIKEFFKFSNLKVTSKDGFILEVDVRLVIRITPANAPFIIARFGSISNLVNQIVHPLIDSAFRNKAGEKAALEFVKERTKLQADALEHAREVFRQYHIEAQGLLVAYIDVDEELLKTQTDREIAIQKQEQYNQQAAAEEKRIVVQEMTAKANKQPEVVAAQLSIEIAKNQAEAAREEAAGIRDSTKAKAEGEAFQVREVGLAQAQSYQAQADALGPQALASIKIVETIGAKGIEITPQILVMGGNGSGGATESLLNTALTGIVASQFPVKREEGIVPQKQDVSKSDISMLPTMEILENLDE
ncbi:MAG: SPFH domain-containing protein [Candidatus Pacebacteria bacterium]|nr:SPFH domain-containing protein [Candidatus Paceibacterota bacterium]